MKTAMIIASDAGARTAGIIREELGKEVDLFSVSERSGCVRIDSITDFTLRHFGDYEAFVFIGAMGICVRAIAPCVTSKYADPAVVNVDATGHFVVSVLAGHVGGANALTERLARILGAQPVVTTQSDNTGLWALDLLGKENGWKMEYRRSLNELISIFVNQRPTALLLDIRDEGTDRLEHSRPAHVDVYYHFEDIPAGRYGLIIAVTPCLYECETPILYYHPAVLHLGVGCRKQCNPTGIWAYIGDELKRHGLSPLAVKVVTTIELKKDEPMVADLVRNLSAKMQIYRPEELKDIEVPNPSGKVFEVTGAYSVSEATALKSAGNTKLLLEKQKGQVTPGNDFTFAVALDREAERSGFIETRLSRVSSSSAAGAGFRIAGTPASLANRATARLTSRGISSCNSTRSYSAICSRSHDTSDAFSVRLAPGMTMMRFWAVWPETASVTWPTPEWQSDRTMTWPVSTPAFCSGSKSCRPNRSSPTQPTIVTSAPSRAH